MADRVANPTQQENIGYFTLDQCIYSNIAHLNEIDNIPGADYLPHHDPLLKKDQILLNLHNLFKHCIYPIYRKFVPRLKLTSVYRNKEVNKLLGGVENSQHIYGYAADIILSPSPASISRYEEPDHASLELFNWCVIHIPHYHQLIWEYPEKGDFNNNSHHSWVHISYIEGSNFKENSVSSKKKDTHEKYKGENTYHLGDFTHRISTIK